MPIEDVQDVPWEIWWVFIGILFFGLLMPFAVSQGVLKVVATLRMDKIEKLNVNFWQRLAIGWLVLIPVYILSVYYFNIQLSKV